MPGHAAACMPLMLGCALWLVMTGNQGRSMMNSSPANCPTALAVTSVSDYDGLPGGTGTPEGEKDLDDTATDFSNWGNNDTASRTIAGPGEGRECVKVWWSTLLRSFRGVWSHMWGRCNIV